MMRRRRSVSRPRLSKSVSRQREAEQYRGLQRSRSKIFKSPSRSGRSRRRNYSDDDLRDMFGYETKKSVDVEDSGCAAFTMCGFGGGGRDDDEDDDEDERDEYDDYRDYQDDIRDDDDHYDRYRYR